MTLPSGVITDHSFLAEELMIPNTNKADGSRLNMVSSHLGQLLVLQETDLPYVFTGFENQVGKYSTGIKFAKDKMKVLEVLEFHKFHKLVLVENQSTGSLDIVEYKYSKNLTESFGYVNAVNENIFQEGTMIDKDEILYHNGMYDDYGNFGMGRNLNTIYLPFKGKTYEDPIVISETAAKMLSHNTVSKYEIMLNSNDVLIKPIGKVGDTVSDGVLTYRRRISNSTILNEFTEGTFRTPLPDDVPFFASGMITDIKVYSNMDSDLNAFYNADLKAIELQQQEVFKALKKIQKDYKDKTFDDDLAFWIRKANDYFNDNITFTYDKSQFEGIVVIVEVTESEPCWIGDKLTGRYGDKGVISMILPDEMMPHTEDGRRVDTIRNSLGVVGRMNIAQLYEHELNFIATEIHRQAKDIDEFNENIMKFFELVAPEMFEFVQNLGDDEYSSYVEDMYESGKIYINQKPFYGNVTFENFEKCYDTFPFVKKIKIDGVQTPLVYGPLYYVKLKHASIKKVSARSTGMTNLVNVPYKTNEKQKKGNALYNNNPIRLGEQETFNLLLLNNPELQAKLIKMYSSSNVYRQSMLTDLLTKDIRNIKSFEVSPEHKDLPSNSTEIVRAIFKAIGVDITHTENP